MKTKCKRTALCLVVLLLFSLAGCSAKEDSYSFIECPVPGLEWNMTKEEVWAEMHIPEELPAESAQRIEAEFNDATEQIRVAPEMFAWEDMTVAGLKLAMLGTGVSDDVTLHFFTAEDGTQYLHTVSLVLVAADDAAAVKALSDAYGEPTGLVPDRTDLLYWVSVDPAKAADEKVFKKCEDAGVRLSYLGLAEPLPAWLLQPYVCFNLVGGSWRIEDMDTDGVGYRLSFTALNYVKTLHL